MQSSFYILSGKHKLGTTLQTEICLEKCVECSASIHLDGGHNPSRRTQYYEYCIFDIFLRNFPIYVALW